MRGLIISYDGLTSQIGQAQLWPYARGLARRGHAVDVLSFEAGDAPVPAETMAAATEAAGVGWHPRRFRQRPRLAAKLADLADMRLAAERLARRGGYDLVHARSYVAASAAAGLKRRHGLPFVFDMRGFWPDQKREGGHWPATSAIHRAIYRRWKRREAALVASADRLVVLTQAARREIEGWPDYRGQPVAVIPCAVDFDAFRLRTVATRAAARAALGIADAALVLVYLGSLGTVYRLTEMLTVFAALKRARPGARMLFVGRHDAAAIARVATGAGLPLEPGDFVVRAAPHGEVGGLLAAGDLAVSLIEPCYSSLAASPTKLGEYMATGLPVICNAGVGDTPEIVGDTGAGLVLPDLAEASLASVEGALDGLLAIPAERVRAAARARFALDDALAAYDGVWCGLVRAESRLAAPAGTCPEWERGPA